jgi:hypothetical protein
LKTQYFDQPDRLSLEQRCQYLTLQWGIRNEQDWIGWCEEAIEGLQGDDAG